MNTEITIDSLKGKMIAGFFWTASSQIGTVLLTLVYNIILARILNPADFGLVSMAQIFTGLVTVLFSLGLGTAIIQKKDVDQETYSTVFWINLGIGLFTAAIVFIFSTSIGDYFNEARVSVILKFMALNFILGSFVSVPIALLSKKMQFKNMGLATLISMLISYAFAVCLASFGYGYWSIVLGNSLQTFLTAALIWYLSRWSPSLSFRINSVKPILGFGMYKAFLSMANYFIKNIDYFFIAKILGAEALGFYAVAFQIASMASKKYRDVFSLVAFPAFSHIQDQPEQFMKGFYKLSYIAVIFLLPLSIIIFLFADDFINLFYGSKWSISVSILQILTISILFQGLNNQVDTMMMALGNVKIVFIMFFLESAMLCMLVYIGIAHKLNGVALAVTTTSILMNIIKLYIFRKYIPIKLNKYFAFIKKPIITIFAVFIVLLIIKKYFPFHPTSLYLFSLQVLFAVIVQAVSIWLILGTEEKQIIQKYIFKYVPIYHKY